MAASMGASGHGASTQAATLFKSKIQVTLKRSRKFYYLKYWRSQLTPVTSVSQDPGKQMRASLIIPFGREMPPP